MKKKFKNKTISARVNEEDLKMLQHSGWTTQSIVDWAMSNLIEYKVERITKFKDKEARCEYIIQSMSKV